MTIVKELRRDSSGILLHIFIYKISIKHFFVHITCTEPSGEIKVNGGQPTKYPIYAIVTLQCIHTSSSCKVFSV